MLKRGLRFLVCAYRAGVSPYRPTTCRFDPTCSQYALDALERRRLPAALILIVWRVLRCNPWCKGGYDPVPEKGFSHHRPS